MTKKMASTLRLLQQTALQLKQEGKQPSLALFKTRLAGQVTAPELFMAYQQWRQQPEHIAAPQPTEDLALQRPIDAEQDFSNQLQRIEQKLDRLLALLDKPNVSD